MWLVAIVSDSAASDQREAQQIQENPTSVSPVRLIPLLPSSLCGNYYAEGQGHQ